jgi:hypothetical protein
LQPLLVSTSAIELAAETVALILRIDDIQVSSRVLDMTRMLTRPIFTVHPIGEHNHSTTLVVFMRLILMICCTPA